MKHLTTLLALAIVLALTACGDVEIAPPEQETDTPAHQREIVLNLQNKLVFPPAGTRATEIATTDEKRIDALDVYVFGSPTLNGVYSYQEKFSYRADGSTVPGADILKMTGTDGSTATPTMMLKPHKGLFIKLYCVANQPDLCWLDNVTDPATPAYKPYTNFTPLTQSRPGEAANVVSPGVPLEADFRKLTTRVIDPVNEADSIVPALPLVGANVATIDLQDLALASRLFISVKLTRAVARFDIVNRADESRFTITSVALGNGRPTTSLFPLEAQRAVDDGLITYPLRQFWGPGTNEGARLSAFYAYASPKADQGFLILNGTYRVNQTDPPEEVTHKIAFDQVKDGTGSYIEITPNHRYTVEITKADQYHVDFTVKVADWEEDEDMGIVIPDNGMGAFTTVPAGMYDAKRKALMLSTNVAYGEFACKLNISSNAALKVEGVMYDKPGFDWIEVGEITMAPATTRTGLWTQTGTCEVKVKEGTFKECPDATILLSNKANGEKVKIRVISPVTVTLPPGSDNWYEPSTSTLYLHTEDGLAATVKYRHGNEVRIPTQIFSPAFEEIETVATDTTLTARISLNKKGFIPDYHNGSNSHAIYLKHAGTHKEFRVQLALTGRIKMMYVGSGSMMGIGSDNRNIYIDPAKGTEETLTIRSTQGVDLEETFSSNWFTLEKTSSIFKDKFQHDEFLFKLKAGNQLPVSFKLKQKNEQIQDVTITVQKGEILKGHEVMTLNGYKVVDGASGLNGHDERRQQTQLTGACPTGYNVPAYTELSALLLGTPGSLTLDTDYPLPAHRVDDILKAFPWGTYWTRSSYYYYTISKKEGVYYLRLARYSTQAGSFLSRCIKKG